MKLNKNTLLFIAAIVLFGIAVKVAMISKASQDRLAGATSKVAAAQADLAHAVTIRKAVMATIPVGNGYLHPIKRVVAQGSIALNNLAMANHLIVSILSIDNTSRGDMTLDSVAKSLPMTHDSIKRIALLLKVNFNNLTSLHDFIEKIPDTGGYLGDIKIKGNEAALTVKFMGV